MAGFKEGQATGFAFQVLSDQPGDEMFCEINMVGGLESGVRHCVAMKMQVHIFMHPKVNGRENGRTIVVAPNGQVVGQKVYKNGKEVTLEIYPNDAAAVRDGRSYLLQKVIPLLGQRRQSRDRRVDQYIRSELWSIPGFELSGGPLLSTLSTKEAKPNPALTKAQDVRSQKVEVSTRQNVTKNSLCLEGDCESGIGKMALPDGGFIVADFFAGRASGFALQILRDDPGKEMYCEVNLDNNEVVDFHHCFFAQFEFHIFRDPQVDGKADGRVMMLDPKGRLFFHEVYSEGEKVTGTIYRDKAQALSEGKKFLTRTAVTRIESLRASRNRGIDEYIPSELWDIPGFRLAGGPLSSSIAHESGRHREPKIVPPPQKPRSPEKIPNTAAPKVAPKAKDPIDFLVEKAAELDRGARQYNPLYKLERVYVDRDAYELVYEFQALKSISKLNRGGMEVGVGAAYCKGFKMIPFRKQNMPSRWKYLDSDGDTMTIVTRVEDC